MPTPLYKKNTKIAKDIYAKVAAGVSVRDLLNHLVATYPDAPKSTSTLYKYYGDDIAQAKADVIERIGNVMIQKALDGDVKAAEFYLRSQGGWSPQSTENVNTSLTPEDEDNSATDELARLLGRGLQDTSEDNIVPIDAHKTRDTSD